jgi:hypothetical protein
VRRERWETCQGGWLIGNLTGFAFSGVSNAAAPARKMTPIAATGGFSPATTAERKLDLDVSLAFLSLDEQQKP